MPAQVLSQLNSWTGFLPSYSEIDAVFERVTECSCALVDELVGDCSACHCKLGSEEVLLECIVILVVQQVWQGENPGSD